MTDANTTVQYITSKEGLKSALFDVLCEFNLIQKTERIVRAPATLKEACYFLNISIPTLRALIRSNQIPAFQIGRQIRIRWENLEDYLNSKS
jgi:excisionase family DNA binding protein